MKCVFAGLAAFPAAGYISFKVFKKKFPSTPDYYGLGGKITGILQPVLIVPQIKFISMFIRSLNKDYLNDFRLIKRHFLFILEETNCYSIVKKTAGLQILTVMILAAAPILYAIPPITVILNLLPFVIDDSRIFNLDNPAEQENYWIN